MTTTELVSYIRKQINSNIPKDLIISKLLGVGWRKEDIDEGFLYVEQEIEKEKSLPQIKTETINIVKPVQINVDQYREPVSLDNSIVEAKIELPKIEPKKEITPTENIKASLPVVEVPQKITVEEKPKVWTPMSVPVVEKEPVKKIESFDNKVEINKPTNLENKEELIPTLIPKKEINSFDSVKNNEEIKTEIKPESSNEVPKKFSIGNLPKSAMLSSYEKDLMSVDQPKEEIPGTKGRNLFKWLIVAVVILMIGGVVWAFVGGFIKISDFNFSFIKKDPKVLLVNNSKVLSSLKAYKTETNIEISSPSFSNISAGLVSGEAVTSEDKDSISINTLGLINQSGSDILSDNFITIKSSILKNYITTDIKNNGSDLFVSVPDLKEFIGDNAPESLVVKVNKEQTGLIPPMFSQKIATELKKIDLYKLVSSGMSSYINNDTLSVYNDFVNGAEITEKGEEKIKNIDTYHYSINADRQLSKKLLTDISNNFTLNLSSEDKDKLDNILGATTVDSFDVWIGKGDSNIYQYNIILDIPLSKIIGFEDKSIGDNKVTINWKTTYYDFDTMNNISMPDTFTSAEDFVKLIRQSELRNDVSSFKQIATSMFNAEGSYGSKPNTNGNCNEPISGSLFSPVGHKTGATVAVSSVSELLNKVLKTTYGAGFCYSNTKAWSFTVPISDNYDPFSENAGEYKSFYCVDSTGAKKELITPPSNVVCE